MEMKEQSLFSKRLADEEVNESCVSLIRTFQKAVNSAVTERGLKGDEPCLLNVVNNGLFGLLMQALLFTEREKKDK